MALPKIARRRAAIARGAAQGLNRLSLGSSDLPDRRCRTRSLGMPAKPRHRAGLLTAGLVDVHDRSRITRASATYVKTCADRQAPILSRERRFGRKRVYRTSTLPEGHGVAKHAWNRDSN